MIAANNKAKEIMERALATLGDNLAKVRTGRATSAMFDNVRVDYYGTPTPVAQTGTISIPEARTIVIKPYDKDLTKEVVKAIKNSGLGLNPMDEGDKLRINIPQMTEEVRKRMVKDLGSYEEDAKVAVRKGRQEANSMIKANKDLSKDAAKDSQEGIQKITDEFSKKVEQMIKQKAEDIMKV